MYTSDKTPLELTSLNTLATSDTFIVGDTSDTDEVVKAITFSDLLTQLQSLLTAAGPTVTDLSAQITPENTIYTSSIAAKWIVTEAGQIFPNKGYTRSGSGPYTYTLDNYPTDFIYLIS